MSGGAPSRPTCSWATRSFVRFPQGFTPPDLDEWRVIAGEVERAATDNLNRLLSGLELSVERRGAVELAWLDTGSPSKASLIFATTLRAKVEGALGWPVTGPHPLRERLPVRCFRTGLPGRSLAVAPARDFLYLFRTDPDDELLAGVAGVVVNEFGSSAYPVTDELLLIGDDGIKALGRFG